jgi:hypothetical protein
MEIINASTRVPQYTRVLPQWDLSSKVSVSVAQPEVSNIAATTVNTQCIDIVVPFPVFRGHRRIFLPLRFFKPLRDGEG